MVNPKIVELFIVEAEELIAELEDGIVSLEERPNDDELINTIFRAAHTIKGSAGISGFAEMVDFAHVLENTLEAVRNGSKQVSPDIISACLQSVDVLKTMMNMLQSGRSLTEVAVMPETLAALTALKTFSKAESHPPVSSDASKATTGKKRRIWQIQFRLNEDIFMNGQDPAMLIVELSDFGKIIEVHADCSALPSFENFNPLKLYTGFNVIFESEQPRSTIENVFLFVSDTGEIDIQDVTHQFKDGVNLNDADKKLGELLVETASIPPYAVQKALAAQKPVGQLLVEQGVVRQETVDSALARQKTAQEMKNNSSIRVDTDKLDRLMNLVGELVTGVAQVTQLSHTLFAEKFGTTENDEMGAAVEFLDQVSRDLQEQVMLVRMVPVEATFTRFKRVVRDLARELKKEVHLKMSGTETELDKNVIEKLVDPLKHLIRNSVDHGIEAPKERIAKGKPAAGTINLNAKQREGSIVIEIEDDGKGIDTAAILNKAKEQGSIPESAELSDKDIFNLLFLPGLSTAKAVTDVSGRGVGMDVVKRNIESLRGSIDVESMPGKGSKFIIRLPLTLAIVEGMNVRVGEEVLTIPLLSIVEQMRPGENDVKSVEGKKELINVRGQVMPLIRLHELFSFHTDNTDPCDSLVMILESEQGKYGLMVDDVLGQQQAVIKSLDKNFTKIDGVSGATILGDGRVSLILDPHKIEQMALHL
ncbi:MAG: chemotaxis protein CheA [Deltaproteobacteria bacterium]|nr:chemotaxis protein CheA [Deltaproteobacteria bacterium]MBN2671099.1 chemotaxis protein CheA [Deltaproteobacteria bacterium]